MESKQLMTSAWTKYIGDLNQVMEGVGRGEERKLGPCMTVGLLCTSDSCPLEASQQTSSVEGECHDTPSTSCHEAVETWQKVHNAVYMYVYARPSYMWYGIVYICVVM